MSLGWRAALPIVLLLAATLPAAAELRRPSCQILVALSDGMRMAALEASFGKRFPDMTPDDLTRALEIVSACFEIASARPPERPGLMRWERRSTQVYLLSVLAEELRFYRTRAVERAGSVIADR